MYSPHWIFICFDALDESGDISGLLNCLHQAPFTIRIFSTGRPHVLPVVRKHFGHTQTIHIKAKEFDIRILIDKKIKKDRRKNPSFMNEQLECCITEKISGLFRGMFVITQYTTKTRICCSLYHGFLLPKLQILRRIQDVARKRKEPELEQRAS